MFSAGSILIFHPDRCCNQLQRLNKILVVRSLRVHPMVTAGSVELNAASTMLKSKSFALAGLFFFILGSDWKWGNHFP
jgi:hypothetical protein